MRRAQTVLAALRNCARHIAWSMDSKQAKQRRQTLHGRFMRKGAFFYIVVLLCTFTTAYAIGRLSFGTDDVKNTSIFRTWDETVAPNYYEVKGKASFDELPAIGTVRYAPLDELGRAGKACACIDFGLMEEGVQRERKSMQDLHPSGWGHNEKVSIELPNGKVYNGFFWNRSHLLAKSLGGSESIENLICGTRMQNVGANTRGAKGGMAYTEDLARVWLEQNPEGYLYYSAEPLYERAELVCRNVIVNVRSSDGTIDQQVIVYNAAKGYAIDYATGRFARE
jgi:DNA-entry nuclease